MGAVAVTGGNRGIGLAIVQDLLARGIATGCLSRSGLGPAGAIALRCDVTQDGDLRAALASLAAKAGGLRGIVNNAGIHTEGRSATLATAEFERVMATNAGAVFTACREAYPHLVAAGGGIIVNIGSFFERLGVKRNLAYCASKAAVGAITRCLAVEWATDNIQVVNVAPGYVETDLNRDSMAKGSALREYLERRIPGRCPGTPDAVARLVGQLIAEPNPFLTGETITLDGGQSIAH